MGKFRLEFALTAGILFAPLAMGCESSPTASTGDGGPGPVLDATIDSAREDDAVGEDVEAGVDVVDAASEPVADSPLGCAVPTGGPTTHQGNIGTETWTAAGSPHLLPYDTSIVGTLTLEACAEVRLAAGRTVSVTGSIVAEGTSSMPVHIAAQDATKPFVMIRTLAGGTLHLAYVTIDGGGDPSNSSPDLTGMLNLQGVDQTKPSQPTIFVDHVSLLGSKTNGLVLRDGAGFAPGSDALTVSGSALYPVSMWSRAVGGLPPGSYTGNGHDEILIPGGGGNEGFAESTTLHDRGVPYHAGTAGTFGDLRVEALPGGAPSTLTIEPGVVMRFKKGGVFHVAFFQGDAPATAALIAVGTPDRPIVFTSAEAVPAAGDWLGVWFGDQPLATNMMDYARVEYAGGSSSSGSNSCPYPSSTRSDAAIRIFGGPSRQFITNTTIANSGYFGIDRGWRKDNLTDFLATNVFENVAFCKQSHPKDANGACPMPVPCPQ